MSILAKAAKAFTGTAVERSDNTAAASMSDDKTRLLNLECFLQRQKTRVTQPP